MFFMVLGIYYNYNIVKYFIIYLCIYVKKYLLKLHNENVEKLI